MADLKREYEKFKRGRLNFITISTLLLFLAFFIGIALGPVRIGFGEIFTTIFSSEHTANSHIINNIRLPRVISACLAGAALSVSGLAMQTLLRNPLASPVSLGISQGAAFGAAFAIVVFGATSTTAHQTAFQSITSNNIIIISAFTFGLIGTLFILIISRLKTSATESIILAGIISGSLFTAGISTLQFFASDVQLSSIVFWMFGDLGRSTWTEPAFLLVVVILAISFFLKKSWDFNTMKSGDETAASLGVNVLKTRYIGMMMAALTTSVAVSFFGVIAFVGLVVPHIVKKFIGHDERYLVPATSIFGALFLLGSDTIARTIFSPVILPVGILTSFMGAPLFVWLLLRKKGGES